MISARFLRDPSPNTAVFVRLVAFAMTAASVVLIPAILFGAATGHGRVDRAFEIVVVAALLTLATSAAARSLDPLRR